MRRTAPGEEREFASNDVAHYLAILQEWYDGLRDIAADAFKTEGIGEEEKQDVQRALKSLDAIGKLVQIVTDPYRGTLGLVDEGGEPTWLTRGQLDFTRMLSIAASNASRLTAQEAVHVSYGLSCVWNVVGAAFVVGSHGVKNPIKQRLQKAGAQAARDAKRSDDIDEVVHRHRDMLRARKPSFIGNDHGTAMQICEGVNADLAKMGIKRPLSANAIRKRMR
jgi:hypothetical protein